MKKLTLFFCLLAVIVTYLTNTVYAVPVGNFAVPNGRECYFCEEKDLSSALFAVPYTYCVEVLKDEGEWLYVAYAQDEGDYKRLTGYCRSEEFTRIDTPPQNLYLHKVIIVTFSADDGQSPLPPPTDLEAESAYYGTYRYGASYYSYVLCRGSFCYVKGANDDYPLNELQPPEEIEKTTTQGKAQKHTGLIIFAVILAVAILIICALALSPKLPKDS